MSLISALIILIYVIFSILTIIVFDEYIDLKINTFNAVLGLFTSFIGAYHLVNVIINNQSIKKINFFNVFSLSLICVFFYKCFIVLFSALA